MAGGESNARDVAAVIDSAGKPRQVVAAEVVDRAGPQRFFERAFPQVDVVANENFVCADTL